MRELTPLDIDDDGIVFTRDDEGERHDIGHVLDDGRCPAGRDAEWAELADRWMEETDDGRAERSLWRQEYEASLGGMR